MPRPALVLALLLVLLPVARATDLHVPVPFPTIQAALTAAASGDTVIVAPGLYVESVDFLGKDVTLTSSGGASVTGLVSAGGIVSTSKAVSFSGGEGPDAVLERFTIRDSATGVWMQNASPTIRDCVLEGMTVAAVRVTNGDPSIVRNVIRPSALHATAIGIDLEQSDATIVWNSLRDISIYGVRVLHDSDPVIERCVFLDIGSEALRVGHGSHPVVRRCRIARCWYGVALYTRGSLTMTDSVVLDCAINGLSGKDDTPDFQSVTFERNFLAGNGGTAPPLSQLALTNFDQITLRDCAIVDHPISGWSVAHGVHIVGQFAMNLVLEGLTVTDAPIGFGLYDLSATGWTVTWRNCIIVGSDYQAYNEHKYFPAYSLIQAGIGPNPQPGNIIGVPPQFVGADLREVHLSPSSPARDAGTAVPSPTDFDNEHRDASPDMGADEFVPTSIWFGGDTETGGTMSLTIQGPPSTPTFLFASGVKRATPIATVAGPFWLGDPLLYVPLGSTNASGVLSFSLAAPSLPFPVGAFVQAWVGTLSEPVEVLVGG